MDTTPIVPKTKPKTVLTTTITLDYIWEKIWTIMQWFEGDIKITIMSAIYFSA